MRSLTKCSWAILSFSHFNRTRIRSRSRSRTRTNIRTPRNNRIYCIKWNIAIFRILIYNFILNYTCPDTPWRYFVSVLPYGNKNNLWLPLDYYLQHCFIIPLPKCILAYIWKFLIRHVDYRSCIINCHAASPGFITSLFLCLEVGCRELSITSTANL